MERELWSWLMRAIRDVSRSFKDSAYHTHRTADIVRVYLWAVLHDRPTYWACDPRSWDTRTRPDTLPSQSTMSRRLRSNAVKQFLLKVGRRLVGDMAPLFHLIKFVDGKPLAVSAHSSDPDATWGHGAGAKQRGYKLHAIYAGNAMPEVWQVRPMHEAESRVAREMIPHLTGTGYLAGDAGYDDDELYRLACENDHRFMAHRRRPYTGLGHHKPFHPDRVRAIATLETQRWIGPTLGKHIMHLRRQIETAFGNLTSFYAGLTHLPPWVRRVHRVELYVHAKLLINAARIRNNRA